MATVEQSIPPLIAGDKLTREEFLRRWEAHPDIKKAELIGGVVYMPSPVSCEHGDTDAHVAGWLTVYVGGTPGTEVGHNSTTLMLKDSPQPDVHLRVLPAFGGQTVIKGKYLSGAPELMVEVCASSASYDLHQKFDLYERAGVREYVAVLLYEREVRWYRRGGDGFEQIAASEDGIFRSQVFPGLWLDHAALLGPDVPRLLAVVQQGLNTPEHAEFVRRLAAQKR